jgi:16S rRNA (adenine1518-N6/adenine1519-N6)-dimethyltransferase
MSAQIKPLKKYGQNFLNNSAYAAKIVSALKCKPDDILVEIGAGSGVLTELLVKEKCHKIYALEIDPRLVEILESKFKTALTVVHTDVLDFSLKDISEKNRIKIIGNIPYYITSDLLFKLLENFDIIDQAVIMLQKEVADRLLAETQCKNYGALTVLTGYFYKVQRLIDIGRENFYPVPKVDSTVINLEVRKSKNDLVNYSIFERIVKKTFQFRRKMLRNTLKMMADNWDIRDIKSTALNKRPEELSIEEFVILANEITSCINNRV